jgi:hypothetical protein
MNDDEARQPQPPLSKGQKKKLKEKLKKQELSSAAASTSASGDGGGGGGGGEGNQSEEKLSKSQRKRLKAKLKAKQEPIEYCDYVDERQLPAVSVGGESPSLMHLSLWQFVSAFFAHLSHHSIVPDYGNGRQGLVGAVFNLHVPLLFSKLAASLCLCIPKETQGKEAREGKRRRKRLQ